MTEQAAPKVIWWKISTWGKPEITPVEVIKETAQFLVIRNRDWNGKLIGGTSRTMKAGEFFPTFEEARTYMLSACDRNIQINRDKYSQLISNRKQLQELQEPKS